MRARSSLALKCNVHGDCGTYRPLSWAAENGHTEMVEYLLSRRASPGATNSSQNTPSHLAAKVLR